MSRRGDDAEAEAFEVVVRARRERQLVLAAVARPGIDVSDRKAAPAAGWRERDVAAESAEVAEEGQHQRSAQA